ncbi:MAG TPA: tetratricopeptide repeat protein [Drouetiella sp.]
MKSKLLTWVVLIALSNNVALGAPAARSPNLGRPDSSASTSAPNSHSASDGQKSSEGLKQLISLTEAQSYGKAANLFEKLIEQDPQNAQLRLAGAKLFRQMGMFARSMSEYKKLAMDSPKMIEPIVALSQMSMEYLNIPEALSYARRAVAMDPSDKNARIALCSALIASDYLKPAEDELGKLQKERGNDPQINYVAYKLNLKRGQLANARQQLESAVKLAPNNAQWLLDLSELCKQQGDYDEATQCLQRAMKVDPYSVDKLNRMAIMQEYFLHDYDAATAVYKQILEIDPESVSALAGLDRCRAKKNDIAALFKTELRSWIHSIYRAIFPT